MDNATFNIFMERIGQVVSEFGGEELLVFLRDGVDKKFWLCHVSADKNFAFMDLHQILLKVLEAQKAPDYAQFEKIVFNRSKL